MCGKWVTLDFGGDFQVRVWVNCTPETSDEELQKLAITKLDAAIARVRYVPAD